MCKKKLLALVGAAVLSVVLTGCGSDKDLFKPERLSLLVYNR